MNYLNERVAKIRSSISDEREDLIRNRRREIANAATKLFRRKGFHKTATRDIAVEMGVSQGHIYQYISRKEDILLLMLDIAVDDYNAKLFGILDEDDAPVAKLERAMRTYYGIIDRHRDKTNVLYNHTSSLDAKDRKVFDLVEMDVTQFFRALIDEGVEAGAFQPVDSFLMAFNIVSLGHMWALKHYRLKGVMSLDAYVDAQVANVLCLLRAGDAKGPAA